MPKKSKAVRSARALVGGLYPTSSASMLPSGGPPRRLLLWAHEDGELLHRRLLRREADEDRAVLEAVDLFRARDGAMPERVVLNSRRLLELSRRALGDAVPCDEGATPQTDRAAATMVGGLLAPHLRPVEPSPGVRRDVTVDCLACFFDHAHALFERWPWRALDSRFALLRLDLGDLGWPRAILELRRERAEGAALVLHRSLLDWRRAQRTRVVAQENAKLPRRLELWRVPRSSLDPALRARMEEFGWLAPVSLQPSARVVEGDGSVQPPSARDLQLMSAAAIVVERLLHLEAARVDQGEPAFVGATVEIQDELWQAEVEIAAPPAALRGIHVHDDGDPSFEHILRCFACSLDEGDEEGARLLTDFQEFAVQAYGAASETPEEELAAILGPEMILVYLRPFLAARFLSEDGDAPERFASALKLCARMNSWLARSRLITDEAHAELRSLFDARQPELLRAAELMHSTQEASDETRRPYVRAMLELLRYSRGRAWFRGVDGRSWGPLAATDVPWLERVERGWRLDMVLCRRGKQLRLDRLLGIYPEGVMPLRAAGEFETSR